MIQKTALRVSAFPLPDALTARRRCTGGGHEYPGLYHSLSMCYQVERQATDLVEVFKHFRTEFINDIR